jgi:uncharacterized protein involved in response to NO
MVRVGTAEYGPRIGIAAVVALITLIGGRIVPSFTRNWLARRQPGRLPTPFARFDALTLAAGGVALPAWVVAPAAVGTGALLLLAGMLHLARLGRWAGERTFAERLVLILHLGYAFVPVGFFLVAGAALWPQSIPASAGIHAWTAGAMGAMTLAVMTRASLGHAGRPLTATAATQAIYGCVLVAALARIAASFVPSMTILSFAALAWILAFATFVAAYGALLARRPPAWAAAK